MVSGHDGGSSRTLTVVEVAFVPGGFGQRPKGVGEG